MTTDRDLLIRAHAAMRGASCPWCGSAGNVLGDTVHRDDCARGVLVRDLADAIGHARRFDVTPPGAGVTA